MKRATARATPLVLVIAALLVGATATAGSAATPGIARAMRLSQRGLLTGTWTGTLTGSARGSIHQERILIVVNTHESAGSWKVSPTCHGSLTLDSISGGYHHYRRRVASGGSCLGGDIDCLMRTGAKMYDSVTPRPGGYALTGSLHRVRSR